MSTQKQGFVVCALICAGALLIIAEFATSLQFAGALGMVGIILLTLGIGIIQSRLRARSSWRQACRANFRRRIVNVTYEGFVPKVRYAVTWGWRKKIQQELIEGVDLDNKRIIPCGDCVIHPNNGNAVVLRFPRESTDNKWVLEHLICNRGGTSSHIRVKEFNADALTSKQAQELLKTWADKYVYGDEAEDGFLYYSD